MHPLAAVPSFFLQYRVRVQAPEAASEEGLGQGVEERGLPCVPSCPGRALSPHAHIPFLLRILSYNLKGEGGSSHRGAVVNESDLGTMRLQARSLDLLSGLGIWCCRELWCRLQTRLGSQVACGCGVGRRLQLRLYP